MDRASLPPGQLVYAIGDIHGRTDLLADLLSSIAADAGLARSERRSLIFLGDYIDRGPDSRGVIDILTSGLPAGFETHFLKGNHEDLLLRFLDDIGELPVWLANGAAATFRSYGVDVTDLHGRRASPEEWQEALRDALPETHRAFFESLRPSLTVGDYFFVHAGVRPGVPLEAQDEQDLVWIREPFLSSESEFGKMVVHGHTPGAIPVIRKNRIGIDTAAVFSNRLTALRLENESRSFLHNED